MRYITDPSDPRPADDGTGLLQAWMVREQARQTEEDRRYAASPEGRIHKLQVKIDAAYMMQTDQGIDATETVAKAEAEIDAIRAELAAAKAARQAARQAEWTPELTASRRAEWNELVKSGALSLPNGKISPAKVYEQEKRQGWTMADLKAAVARHGQ